ncbi:MAG TPA: CapA family protein [Actinomycetota bacterium]|nr:CapA family protein [Actinomycetota bacterium]
MRLALAGDTMLGRLVGEQLTKQPSEPVVSPAVAAACRDADLFILNLECCISDRGEPWPAPGKSFFFRAPPRAVETLVDLGVGCVTLANNHALDFGAEALLDTLSHLDAAGIRHVGASDHPADFAAAPDRPGIAFADLRSGVPTWLSDLVHDLASEVDVVLVTPHWGPNMTAEPISSVQRAAATLVEAGAALIAGHSAHVFHGVEIPVLFDLGDFLDDYAVDPVLRNDLGLLWFVEVDAGGPVRVEALPLKLGYRYTDLAEGDEARWIRTRFRDVCAAMGTDVEDADHRQIVRFRQGHASLPK